MCSMWPSHVNPLSPVDAYLRQIIECAKDLFTHICVKGEGVRFNHPFGSCKWAMPMSTSVQVQQSFFYILTTSPAPLAPLAEKASVKLCTSFSFREQILQRQAGSQLEASCGIARLPTIVSHHCQLSTAYAQWQIPVRFLRLLTYQSSYLLRPSTPAKTSKHVKAFHACGLCPFCLHNT